MNLYGISCILTAATSFAMAIFVYIKGRKYRLAKIWAGLAIGAAIYGSGAYLVTNAHSPNEAFAYWQIAYLGIILIPFFFDSVLSID